MSSVPLCFQLTAGTKVGNAIPVWTTLGVQGLNEFTKKTPTIADRRLRFLVYVRDVEEFS